MSLIDIILLAVLFGSVIYGVSRGLIRQIASLGGMLLGLIACRLFGDRATMLLTDLLPGTFASHTTAAIAGNIALFLLVWLTVGAIAAMLHKLTHAIMLSWLDHLSGGIFSLFKWMLVLSIILNLWHMVAPDSAIFHNSTLMDGYMLPWVMRIAPALFGIVTDNAQVIVPPIV